MTLKASYRLCESLSITVALKKRTGSLFYLKLISMWHLVRCKDLGSKMKPGELATDG